MAQLVVRKIEEQVVRKLKERAGMHGISMEEEHRRILRESLLGQGQGDQPSFKDYLLNMPDPEPDNLFERDPSTDRDISL